MKNAAPNDTRFRPQGLERQASSECQSWVGQPTCKPTGFSRVYLTSTRLNINGENAYGNYRNIFSAHCIRLYNRELTENEIKYNYLIDRMRFGL